jgi:hypothetical protein
MAQTTADTEVDSAQTASELTDGLEEVHAAVTDVLKKVNNEGDQIEKVVGRAFIGRTNREAAGELRESIASHIGDAYKSHEEIDLNEILIALWTELYRASEMATHDPATDEADSEGNSPSDAEEADSTGSRREHGQLFRDEDVVPNSENESSEEVADPAFQ